MTAKTPNTALILIDVYNDFLHPSGKANSALSPSLSASNTIPNLHLALAAARAAHIPIYYSLHQQSHDGKYTGFKHWNAMLESVKSSHSFEEGSWGATIYAGLEPDAAGNADVVISKHWNQSSFFNTDLDWLLRQREITHLVFAGMVANTCLETTARDGNELGYNITMLSDATAGWTVASKDAAVQYSWPAFAHGVLSTSEWQESLNPE